MGRNIIAHGDNSIGIGLDYNYPHWNVSDNNVMAIMGGNVGIGTTSPSAELHVDGDIKVSYSDSYRVGAYRGLGWNSGTGSIRLGDFAPDLEIYSGSSTPRMVIKDSGNVGIGTTNPGELLEVNGNVKATSFLGDGSNLTGVVTTETDPIFMASPASGISTGNIHNWNTAFGWGDHASAGYDTSDDSWTGIGDIYTTSGNVGIGTTSPSYLLHVLGGTGIVAQFSGRVKGAQAVNDDEFVTKAQVKSIVTSQYTPTETNDPNGELGDTAWDTDYFYVKTPDGWKRAALETWETPELVAK
jgi:hypothetical protein